ncbi:MAG: hypothetical protein HYY17_17285 [Planctomycetes bacterium]|nr:hypothetical protein [Planctomycetota bacterium]
MRRDSPNLYEILKTATGEAARPPETQPRVVPTPAAEAPVSRPATAVVETPPSRVAVPSRPAPTVPETPVKPATGGPGERVLRVTMNSAIFAGLVALGLAFLAFAIGQRVGRSKGRAETAAIPAERAAERPPASDAAPTGARRAWAIKLMEWSAGTTRDSLIAEKNSEDIKKTLEQKGLKEAWHALVVREDRKSRVLYYGNYDRRDDASRKKLAALQKFDYKGGTPFAKADFVEIDP